MVCFLVALAMRASTANPGLPIPFRIPLALEIELDMSSESSNDNRELAEIENLSPAEISLNMEDDLSADG